MRTRGEWLGPAAALGMVAVVLVACGQPAATPVDPPSSRPLTTSQTTASDQGRPDPGVNGGVPSFKQPYKYGEAQAKVPPTADGKAPLVRKITTDKPYVFITIDDGAVRDPAALDLMRKSGVRPTLFLNTKYVEGHADYFKQLQDQANASIQAHTTDHPNLKGKPYEFQHKEICENQEVLAKDYARKPVLFRPPFGNYDANTLKVAADCGFKAVVTWVAAVNDGVVQFQVGDKLRPGDIVLMHFRKTFVEDFTAFLNQAKQDGLTPVPLDDFLT